MHAGGGGGGEVGVVQDRGTKDIGGGGGGRGA